MSDSIDRMTATELRSAFAEGRLSATEIVDGMFDAIKARDEDLSAYLRLMEEHARERAKELDEKRDRGEDLGLLAGVPVAVKDNICTQGTLTTCASKILEKYVPPYNAHVVERLLDEDAIILGKTNMDEFAMGSSTENSGFNITRNPWDTSRIPGGSSGGSAAAVAARMAPLALGSDTGGSIRQPAALCSIVGMKPTYGRVSRYGLVAFASSLDQIGPMARTAEDAALLLQVIAEPDSRDTTCANRPTENYLEACKQGADGMTIGLPKEFFIPGVDSRVEDAMEETRKVYEDMGFDVEEVSLPHSRIDTEGGELSSFAVACYYILCTAEASSNLARYDGVRYGHRSQDHDDMVDMYSRSREEGFGSEVKRRIMLGTYVLSKGYYDAYFLKAARVRRLIKQDFEQAFEDVDLILAPTTPTPPFKIGEKTDDPLKMYLSDIFTISCNLAGIGGISLPCGFTEDGLPLGMQLMGAQWDESKLLQAARAFQQETDYHERAPECAGGE